MPKPSTIELPTLGWTFACMMDREPRGGAHVYEQRRHFAVSNLGWLLRHASEVHDVYVSTARLKSLAVGGGPPFGYVPYRSHEGYNFDALLAARLEGARVYVTEFASRTVLRDWLDRPKFQGLRVSWDHTPYLIGASDYRALYKQTGGAA